MNEFDFVAIGDVVTDAFIRLREAEVHDHIKTHTKEICMPFATKIPFESVTVIPAVGNCANAAVAAARLGLSSALVSNQGDDDVGKKNLEALEREHVATNFIVSYNNLPSNYHYVLLFKSERTILVKHEKYPYTLPDVGNPKWLYLTSLGEHSLEFHAVIADYLDAHPNINLVFQPGTFQIKLGKEKLARIYSHSKIFFCNKEEAQAVLGMSSPDIQSLLKGINKLGPEIVVITDGPSGAYAFDSKANEMWYMPIYPDIAPPVDRTGAGDAYSSTVTIALALGKTLPEALAWAPINSMSVVQYIGAREGLLSREKIEGYLAKASASYKPKKL